MEIYYKINLDIINNFNFENINYQILKNINEINQNLELKDLDEIINENNINSGFEKIINLYNNINKKNEKIEKDINKQKSFLDFLFPRKSILEIFKNMEINENLNDSSLTDDQELREKYITKNLCTDDKMKIYEAILKEDLNFLKQIINQDNIFEELSQKNYYWTGFHYAMHYGKWECIKFLSEYLISKNLFDIALRLKSNDKRCPLLCLLKSNALSLYTKKDIYSSFIKEFHPPISEEVQKELKKRKII